MKKMRISTFVVFIIGMIAIIIHILTLKTSSRVEPKDVTAPTADTLSTEITTTPDNDYPVVQLVNNESNFNYSENESKSESEIDDIIEPFILLNEEEKRDFSALVYLEEIGRAHV